MKQDEIHGFSICHCNRHDLIDDGCRPGLFDMFGISGPDLTLVFEINKSLTVSNNINEMVCFPNHSSYEIYIFAFETIRGKEPVF